MTEFGWESIKRLDYILDGCLQRDLLVLITPTYDTLFVFASILIVLIFYIALGISIDDLMH